MLRMVDANANRAREALRVLEDYCRFALNDNALSAELKAIRHGMAGALAALGPAAILARDTTNDVGTTNKTQRELVRESLADVVLAAGKRLSEALRVMEECAKSADPAAARTLEGLRYRGYVIEQQLVRTLQASARFGEARLYVLLTEALCHAAHGGWVGTLEQILSGAAAAGRAGQLVVQLREKSLESGELLARARQVAERCRAVGAISIINDRPDIAHLANADGVHLGQSDLPCADVRKLLGPAAIIGVSTERVEQARQAQRDGATYIGVGPMFATTTKEKPRIAGPAYAAEAVREVSLPAVAIGGITLENVGQVTGAGIRCVAVCQAVIAQADTAGATKAFLGKL